MLRMFILALLGGEKLITLEEPTWVALFSNSAILIHLEPRIIVYDPLNLTNGTFSASPIYPSNGSGAKLPT